MKVAFMGSDPVALPMLDYLCSEACEDIEVVLVFTQPDRRTGRGMRVHINDIKAWAQKHSIQVKQPLKCGEEEAALLRNLDIDLVLVMAYGQILPRCVLEATANKVMNFHASILPRLRGASPVHSAVALGLEKTGVSLMEIVPKMDAGPVAEQEEIPIPPQAMSPEVLRAVGKATVALVSRGLKKLRSGKLEFKQQDPARVTYCRIIEKTDRYLDFNQDALELHNRIRAFQPWPGTTFLHGDMEIRIIEAQVVRENIELSPPGTVLILPEGLHIVCGKHLLKPLVLQRPGGKPLPVEDFLRGHPVEEKVVLTSRPMRPLEQSVPFRYKKR